MCRARMWCGPELVCRVVAPVAPTGSVLDGYHPLSDKYSQHDASTLVIAGTGQKGDNVERADPLKTQLNRPHGVFVDKSGDLYITDSYNHRILKMRNW